MKINNIVITTNINKSQITDAGTHWDIMGIPVTVDDVVMNRVLYPKDHNAKGLPSIVNKPITLTHPKDKDGNHISGREGEGLTNFFSGGVVTKEYNKSGVNYVNASIKKSTLKAQDNSEWFVNALDTKGDIGVSTGLTIAANEESGTSKDGIEYDQIAIDQQYDHLAMLDPSEAPAGGDSTFMRFNSESDSKLIICNVDEHMKDKVTLNSEDATIFTKLKAIFGSGKEKEYNVNESGHLAENQPDNQKVVNVDRKKMEAMAENMGMKYSEDMSDDDMFNGMMDYSKNMGKKKNEGMSDKDKMMDKDKMKKNSSDETPEWAKTLIAANAKLSDEVETLKSGITANAKAKHEDLAKQVSELQTNSLPLEQALKLDIDYLQSHLAANDGHLNVNAASGGFNKVNNDKAWDLEMPSTTKGE